MTDDKVETGRISRRVTAQTVAEAAGVSRSAVSRAFTEGAYLDREKRRRIHKVAAELGYKQCLGCWLAGWTFASGRNLRGQHAQPPL